MYVCVPSEAVGAVAEAVRLSVRVRFLLFIISVLAIAIGGCATSTFEERLSYLDLLKSRGTLTEAEYAIMRRRLVETVDPATLRAPPDVPSPLTEPERSREPLSAEWVVGSWSGAHTGGGGWHWDVVTIVEFSLTGDDLQWRMTRRFRSAAGESVAQASGTAAVRENRLEMTGTYVDGSYMASDGTPVAYSLQRAGDRLEGIASGADSRTRTLLLHRVPASAAPAASVIPPQSLVGVWTGTLLVARRSATTQIQDNPATLRIFAEANDLRWTLESSYYGERLTGSGTVIASRDQVKLLGTYNVPAGGGGHYGVATGARASDFIEDLSSRALRLLRSRAAAALAVGPADGQGDDSLTRPPERPCPRRPV